MMSLKKISYKTFQITALCCFTLMAQNGFGQEPKKSAQYKSLSKTRETTISDLLQEAGVLKEKDAKGAFDKVEEALALSIIHNDPSGEAKSYTLMGEINETIEEWKLAIENYKLSFEKLSDNHRGTPEFKRTLLGLGTCYLKLNQHAEALDYFTRYSYLSLTQSEKTDAHLNISEVYYQANNYTQALEAAAQAETINPNPDDLTRVKIQNQKAKIFAKTNDLEKATDLYQSSQNTLRSNPGANRAKEEKSLESAKEDIIDVMREQKRYDDEIEFRNQSIEYNLESNNLKGATKDKVELGKALAARGETTTALKELEEAARIADTIGSPKDQAKAFLALADLYTKNNRTDRALDAYKRYSAAVIKTEEQNETRLTEKSDLLKKQKDIEEVTKYLEIGRRDETIQQATVYRQQLTIYGLTTILFILIITSYFIYRNARASKTANQLLALKSLRSQMNPHFIFNALNSVNHFIAQNDERTANRFLSEFSMLMRSVLENSQEDFIPLLKEHEIISLYLKLEHYRFRDKFEYEIKIDDAVNMEAIEIPPMLIQPYIENAVWHGLRYKNSKGHLSLQIKNNAHGLLVEITDDGIGRKKSIELKTENQKKHSSTGLKNIQDRLSIINNVYKMNYYVTVEDLDKETRHGTRVIIHLPAQSQKS